MILYGVVIYCKIYHISFTHNKWIKAESASWPEDGWTDYTGCDMISDEFKSLPLGKGAESRPNQKPLKSLNITIYRTTNYSIYLTIEIE